MRIEMKDKKPSMEILRQLCGEVRDDDGVDPRRFAREERNRKTTSRDRQLCAQVKRCLDLILPEALHGRGIAACEVQSVAPAPDATRMAVVVAVDLPFLAPARELLPSLKGWLRSEVARDVHRKRAPDLAFEVIAAEEVGDG